MFYFKHLPSWELKADLRKTSWRWLAAGNLAYLLGCASFQSQSDRAKPISNPFSSFHAGSKTESPIVLRSKKGDRSVEVEIPGNTRELSQFVLPIAPAFKEGDTRDPSSPDSVDIAQAHPPSQSDREITNTLAQNSPVNQEKRQEIEENLNLIPVETESATESGTSYLASMDHIKQLYRNSRYEAALLETDDLLKQYQTDPKLYEMKGTLLDRLGRRQLALKSWNQALRLNPDNASLRKFIDQHQTSASARVE
jgi:tetratricopeptide (TPR) repeat protein